VLLLYPLPFNYLFTTTPITKHLQDGYGPEYFCEERELLHNFHPMGLQALQSHLQQSSRGCLNLAKLEYPGTFLYLDSFTRYLCASLTEGCGV
jgi:hypothetical protein